ncbi:unnamed protein product [Notodromas monacha]|uniref:ADP-dependent glucokinase n=1 Tax=Notodromas monacha TaxID=399045 RepID=A0A7R9BIN3_9CRUS|nr:unnamed protein product [Notodromas monacha]CAG0916221.1 unnamed protein product [Notodromas monacha]
MALKGPLSWGSVISVMVAVGYYWWSSHDPAPGNSQGEALKKILQSLLKIEEKNPLDHTPRVAVGYGGCLDVVVDASDVFNFTDRDPVWLPKHHGSIQSWKELEEVFLYFFQHGAAGERFVANSTTWQEVLMAVERIKGRETIGGNAPVMAARFRKEGCQVLLGAELSAKLRANFPADVKISSSGREEDDVHLIIEYPFADTWGKYVAPRANRFIIHSDRQNPKVSALEPFHAALESFTADVFIVSGLQMMDNFPFPEGERVERIIKIREQMRNTSAGTRVHFEMASFTDENLLRDLAQHIIPYADSLGMNEQELPILFAVLAKEDLAFVSDAYPRIANTLDTMRQVFGFLQGTEEVEGRRKLTRLHVHTLAFQAIMVSKGSAWKNTMAATAKASLTANRHVCGSEEVDVGKAKLIMDESFTTSGDETGSKVYLDEEHPIACWDEGDLEICIAPVLVCTEVRQTAGGGDNISAGGLVLQI